MDSGNNPKDIFQTIGAALAFALLILQALERLPVIRHFFPNFIYLTKRRWRMLREWFYWQKYHPLCRLVSFEPLTVSKVEGYDYVIETRLSIELENRDNYALKIGGEILLIVESEKKGLAKGFYELYRKKPAEIPELSPKGKITISDYEVRGFVRGTKPLLKPSPECLVNVTQVNLQLLNKARTIKSNSFKTRVVLN